MQAVFLVLHIVAVRVIGPGVRIGGHCFRSERMIPATIRRGRQEFFDGAISNRTLPHFKCEGVQSGESGQSE
jgi:hypothetical protein